ncbi:MAG: hypothetical protein ACFFD2_06235 [Promethearchaeota archaeon]
MQFVTTYTGAEFSIIAGRFTPNIYEVVPEEGVVQAYVNEVSFKHFLVPERWAYQFAVAQCIQELRYDVTQKYQEYTSPIIDLLVRWYDLGTRAHFFDADVLTELMPSMRELAATLKLKVAGLTSEELLAKLWYVFTQHDPKYLVAVFATHCQDRFNLGQTLFLCLVTTGRGSLDIQNKVKLLQTHFAAEWDEFLSFFLFRRAIWTELLLARHSCTAYSWAWNFVVGAANKFQAALQTAGIRLPEVRTLTAPEVQQAVSEIAAEVQKFLAEKQEAGGNVSRIRHLLNSLHLIKANPDVVTTFFELAPTDSSLICKRMKAHTNTVRSISFSTIRKVIIWACSHRPEWQYAIEKCLRLFTPETALKRSFREQADLHPLPINLIIGSKYVTYRLGNAAQLQALLLREGGIWFEIPQIPLVAGRQPAKVAWIVQKSVLKVLKNGAKVISFQFSMPQGSGMALKETIMLEGPESVFLGTAYLQSSPEAELVSQKLVKGGDTSKQVLGLDVNCPNEWLLTAGNDLGFSQAFEQSFAHWRHAEENIATLQQKWERTHSWKRRRKLKVAIQLHHQRRAHLNQQFFHAAQTHLGQVIQALGVAFVSIEGNYTREIRDKQGGLAKAIAFMPDHLELVAHAVIAVNQCSQRTVKCVLVRKEGTSQVHHACGRRINRVGDLGTCHTCGQEVNVHQNAAANIEVATGKLIGQHLYRLLEIVLAVIVLGGPPAACTRPGTQPPDLPNRGKG